MATRMLIDARHPEETRVAVLKGNRIEEFDFESAEHKQIKGNIYLAKVTRVEPSLQAAFVDFGGNRHGFLAFGEIHPDYYQIPAEDRAALLAEEQAHAEEEAALRAAEEEDDDGDDDSPGFDDDRDDGFEEIDTSEKDDVATIEDGRVEDDEASDGNSDDDDDSGDDADEASDEDDGGSRSSRRGRGRNRRQGRERSGGGSSRSRAKEMDELRAKRQALRRRYKIQDVIQRRQVLLVQVVKEERGNKGAALTTYLSLAGRYCVLMPNSSHGGGISRKISNGADRKRLKQIVSDLTLPKSMGLIVRTAGLQRNKTEIKRDFDYLARLWDEIRENTLKSSAPAVIHSDSDLIKRAIRDIYNREIEEVVVEGEEGYKAARQFMKLLMPSHARRIKSYSDAVPLFQRYGAEDQLSAMYDPMVQLKSGGYLVINPTEALVSIDINSGRSTKEHGIEQTALATNLEAAREIARQLRLRDMAGLVVIDFIDMEHNSNVRKVEKAMKDSLKNDRARIQVGRISGFGLMEMSRQRLRTGVLEATTRTCPHCDGTGLVRTASSAGLSALRLIEDEAAKGKGSVITLFASTEAAVYLLNAKRADLAEIESRYNVAVEVVPEGEDEGAKMRIESSGPRPTQAPRFDPIVDDDEDDIVPDDDEDETEEPAVDDAEPDAGGRQAEKESGEDGPRKKRRRRRRGGRNRNRDRDQENGENQSSDRDDEADDEGGADESEDAAPAEASSEASDTAPSSRRRGSRRRKRTDDDRATDDAAAAPAEPQEAGDQPVQAGEGVDEAVSETQAEPRSGPEAEPEPAPEAETETGDSQASPAEPDAAAVDDAPKPRRTSRRKRAEAPSDESEATPADAPKPRSRRRKTADAEDGAPAKPKAARAPRRKKAVEPAEEAAAEITAPVAGAAPEQAPGELPEQPPAPEPESVREAEPAPPPSAPEPVVPEVASHEAPSPDEMPGAHPEAANDGSAADAQDEKSPPRRGWWQRTFGN